MWSQKYEETYMISINGMNIQRVHVTKFLGVHINSKLNWHEHMRVIHTKVAKNVPIMNRVKHCLMSSALYSLYCTLILPYLSYCCEIWGNTYKGRIHPLSLSSWFPFVRGEVLPATFSPPHPIVSSTLLCLLSSSSLPPLLPSSHLS